MAREESLLAEPGPGGLPEILFRRLLDKCWHYRTVDSSGSWRRDPKYHHYVDTLRKQLDQLQKSASGITDEGYPESLASYADETASLLNELELPLFPSYVDPGPEPTPQTNASGSVPGTIDPDKVLSSLKAVPRANTRMLNARNLTLHAQKELQVQDDLQEALTDQMLEMSTALKNNVQMQAAGLTRRNVALDETSSHLIANVQGVKSAAKGAASALKRSRRSFWFSLFVLFSVGGVFAGMYVFITFTSIANRFVPYKTLAQDLFPSKPAQHLRNHESLQVPEEARMSVSVLDDPDFLSQEDLDAEFGLLDKFKIQEGEDGLETKDAKTEL